MEYQMSKEEEYLQILPQTHLLNFSKSSDNLVFVYTRIVSIRFIHLFWTRAHLLTNYMVIFLWYFMASHKSLSQIFNWKC